MGVRLLVLLCLVGTLQLLAQRGADPEYYKGAADRLNSYWYRTYADPVRFTWLLVDSAKDTCFKDPHQWDRSAQSYSYRIASGMGRRIVRNTAQFGFESLLHEDSRYRPSNRQGIGRRMLFAISHSVLAYTPDGSVEPAYGRIAAGVVGAASSSTWHPQSISARALLCGVVAGAMDRSADNLLTEFRPDLIQFGRKTWNKVTRK